MGKIKIEMIIDGKIEKVTVTSIWTKGDYSIHRGYRHYPRHISYVGFTLTHVPTGKACKHANHIRELKPILFALSKLKKRHIAGRFGKGKDLKKFKLAVKEVVLNWEQTSEKENQR